jgi:hypothetical protein
MAGKEIKVVTGLSLSTVYSALRRLHSEGLVNRCADETWVRVPDCDLDAVAERLGTFGATDRQRQRHADERAFYRDVFGYEEKEEDPATGEIKRAFVLGGGYSPKQRSEK